MKISIVGGRGFIGAAIARDLRAAGHEVTIVTHDESLARTQGYRHGDVLDETTLGPAVEGAEVVILSATFPSYPIEKERLGHTFVNFDSRGTRRLVDASARAGVRRFVYVSGVGADPDSHQSYQRAIWDGEQYALESPLEAVCVAPAFVYGPRDRGLNRIVSFARRIPIVPLIGRGDARHQPVFIDDLSAVVVRTVGEDAPVGRFEVGGPETMTLNEMLRRVFDFHGLGRRWLLHLPHALSLRVSAVLERLPGPPLTRAAIDYIANDFVADNRAAAAAFGLSPRKLEEGLALYVPRPGSGDSRST